MRRRGLSTVAVAALLAATTFAGGRAQTPSASRNANRPPAAPASQGPYQAAVELPHLQDGRIGESSGVAASRRNPGLFWTHNDSGGKPEIYAFDAEGNTVAAFTVRGARASDWEDIAYGPGPNGQGRFLYLGDIGDNNHVRTDCAVYRVEEPLVRTPTASAPNAQPAPQATGPAVRRAFVYPDGRHDAEALLVHPRTGVVYVVTKEFGGTATVYRFPPETAGGAGGSNKPVTLVKVAMLLLPGDLLSIGSMVTGGDIAPDGRKAALCTYDAAYEWTLPAGAKSFDAIWKTPLVRITAPPMPQREAICYLPDGKSLLMTSEKAPARVYRLDAVK